MATIEQHVAAAPATVRTPDLYQLQGGQIQVSYATSGIDGKPHLTYHDPHQSLSFTGDQIRTVKTEIGTLVTVTIRLTVDSGSTSFSVLIPTVNLGSTTQANISTEGITTVHRFSLVPALNLGQTETYSVVALTGTASFVVF